MPRGVATDPKSVMGYAMGSKAESLTDDTQYLHLSQNGGQSVFRSASPRLYRPRGSSHALRHDRKVFVFDEIAHRAESALA
jgi:hypothetical protein